MLAYRVAFMQASFWIARGEFPLTIPSITCRASASSANSRSISPRTSSADALRSGCVVQSAVLSTIPSPVTLSVFASDSETTTGAFSRRQYSLAMLRIVSRRKTTSGTSRGQRREPSSSRTIASFKRSCQSTAWRPITRIRAMRSSRCRSASERQRNAAAISSFVATSRCSNVILGSRSVPSSIGKCGQNVQLRTSSSKKLHAFFFVSANPALISIWGQTRMEPTPTWSLST